MWGLGTTENHPLTAERPEVRNLTSPSTSRPCAGSFLPHLAPSAHSDSLGHRGGDILKPGNLDFRAARVYLSLVGFQAPEVPGHAPHAPRVSFLMQWLHGPGRVGGRLLDHKREDPVQVPWQPRPHPPPVCLHFRCLAGCGAGQAASGCGVPGGLPTCVISSSAAQGQGRGLHSSAGPPARTGEPMAPTGPWQPTRGGSVQFVVQA